MKWSGGWQEASKDVRAALSESSQTGCHCQKWAEVLFGLEYLGLEVQRLSHFEHTDSHVGANGHIVRPKNFHIDPFRLSHLDNIEWNILNAA